MMIRLFGCVIIFLLPFVSVAQSLANKYPETTHHPLPYGERIILPSTFLNSEQVVDVYLPQSFELDSDTTQYPLIVTLDGWALSQTVSGIASHLMNTAALPDSVIIALHTDVFSMVPRAYVHSTDNWPANPSNGLAYAFENNGINAAVSFWQFLERELIPFVEQHYRTNRFRTLVGMSPTAYMGLHTMLRGPDLFNAYVLIAAMDVLGLGYSEEKDFVDEIIQAAAKGALDNKFLYIASAEFEARREPRHYGNQKKLIQGLTAYTDKVSFKAEHIDHFGHYPVAIPAMTNALNLIFPRVQFQQFQAFYNESDEALSELVEHYVQLSVRYGVTLNIQTDIPRNPNSLRSIGYRLLKRQDYAQAQQAFERWIEISDKNPNAYYWLSRVLASKGEFKKAIANVNIAIQLAAEKHPENLHHYLSVLGAYKTEFQTN